MTLTQTYTLENYTTGEIETHNIPESVLSLTFEEILEYAFGELGSVELNPIELLFSCIFREQGWRVARTPLNRNKPIDEMLEAAIERATGISDAIHGRGVPDLFLWKNSGEHRFVEIKASENSLNQNQREWESRHDYELFVAQLAPVGDELTDQQIADINELK